METIDNKEEGKDKFILTGNSGEVYYNNDTPPAAGNNSALGDYECKKCLVKKPFEMVRWNPEQKVFVCLDCLNKNK